MKDWKISEYNELVHEACNSDFICTKDELGEWCCIGCGQYAPEEIQFVADLARCKRVRCSTLPEKRSK